jgi:hypothetical protein
MSYLLSSKGRKPRRALLIALLIVAVFISFTFVPSAFVYADDSVPTIKVSVDPEVGIAATNWKHEVSYKVERKVIVTWPASVGLKAPSVILQRLDGSDWVTASSNVALISESNPTEEFTFKITQDTPVAT